MDFSNLFKLLFKPSEVDFIEANAVIKAIKDDGQSHALHDIEPPELYLEGFLNEYSDHSHSDINEVAVSSLRLDYVHVAIVHYVVLSASKVIEDAIADFLGGEFSIHAGVIGGCVDATLVLTAVELEPHEAIYKECERAGLEAAQLAELMERKYSHTLKALPQWETVITSLKDMDG